jgi:hypothetical protein
MPPGRFLLPGVLAQGYRVASGPSRDYPYGALAAWVNTDEIEVTL